MIEEPRKIMIVDDEPDVTELLEYRLQREGFSVHTLNDPLRVISDARDFKPDLIILDVMMPELSGIQVSRILRADPLLQDVPIVFLTAKGEAEDRLKGFESGADDYIVKPFDIREVVLRIRAIFKRANRQRSEETQRLQVGDIVIDVEKYEVAVTGKPVELTATEFKLLKLLLERKGRVQTRENLLVNVWNYEADIETRTVDTHIRRLREKLGSAADIIETVRGVGYRVSNK